MKQRRNYLLIKLQIGPICHLREGSPHFNYQAMTDNFVHINSKDSADEAIIYKLSEFKKTQVLKNRHVLSKIIETLLLCGKQNIAIRGHIPQLSNFMAILNSKARHRVTTF
jgi:hypothetical protein